jgi:lysophospholipase L1-like esterase
LLIGAGIAVVLSLIIGCTAPSVPEVRVAVTEVEVVEEKVVMICCDSITAGVGAQETNGYQDILQGILADHGMPATFVNVAVSGSRCDQWSSWLPAKLDEHQPDILLLNCGTNDYQISAKSGWLLKNAYSKLVIYATERGINVITSLVQISARDNPLVPAFLPDSEVKVNTVIRDLTQTRYEQGLIGRIDLSVIVTDTVNTPDGIHPSSFGHQFYANAWFDEGVRLGWW